MTQTPTDAELMALCDEMIAYLNRLNMPAAPCVTIARALKARLARDELTRIGQEMGDYDTPAAAPTPPQPGEPGTIEARFDWLMGELALMVGRPRDATRSDPIEVAYIDRLLIRERDRARPPEPATGPRITRHDINQCFIGQRFKEDGINGAVDDILALIASKTPGPGMVASGFIHAMPTREDMKAIIDGAMTSWQNRDLDRRSLETVCSDALLAFLNAPAG